MVKGKAYPSEFFERDTVSAAKELLGTFLAMYHPEGTTIGRIVETESYLGRDDPAAHSYNGLTKRTTVMFGPPAHAYVYFIYGMYYCLNIVTGKEGAGEAVLIRALEPVCGIDLMMKRRKTSNLLNLCNGPAKLTQAMGIGPDLNGADLARGPVKILATKKESFNIITSPRVGITKARDLPLRFYVEGNKYISRK